MKAFIQLVIANIKELLRDRMSMFWFIAFPIFFILLFGAIFSGSEDTASFAVGVVQQDNGPIAKGLDAALASVPVVKLHIGAQDAELAALRKGSRDLVVILPAGLSSAVKSQHRVEIPVYYDGTKQMSSQVGIPLVEQVLNQVEAQATGHPLLLEARPQAVQAVTLKEIDYLLPGILAMALMQLGLFSALRLVSLRERKILKRLGATPLPRGLLIASEVTVRLLLAMMQALLIVIIGRLVFGVTIVSSWYLVAAWVLLGACTFVSLGYMLVSFARTVESGQGIVQLVQFPMMFLAGTFFPISFIPGFLQPFVKAMPLTYLADALRQVMTGNPPLFSIGADLGILLAWFTGSLLLGIRFFRWE
ncbi:MAG: ABC transporter permease [Thermacetogeniaceae bacterium]